MKKTRKSLNILEVKNFQQHLQEQNIYENIAYNITRKRKEYGITQSNLAYLIGTNTPKIKHWEYTQTKISVENLLILSKLFNTSVEDLVKRD